MSQHRWERGRPAWLCQEFRPPGYFFIGPRGGETAARPPNGSTNICYFAITEDPGCAAMLIERRRIGLGIRGLEGAVDPLFRHVGIKLDQGK